MSRPSAVPPRFTRSETTRSETTRTEAFSDAVLAIAVTILALELTDPPHRPGGLGRALLHRWPVYLGYLASFSYLAVIWLNHHQAFVRIRHMDRGLHAANLALLFTSAALAFPTSVVSEALQEDLSGADARVAVALYAGIAAAMCLSWTALYGHLHRHPELLGQSVEASYVPHGRIRSWAGAVAYLVTGAAGVLFSPSSRPCRSSTSSPARGCRAGPRPAPGTEVPHGRCTGWTAAHRSPPTPSSAGAAAFSGALRQGAATAA